MKDLLDMHNCNKIHVSQNSSLTCSIVRSVSLGGSSKEIDVSLFHGNT